MHLSERNFSMQTAEQEFCFCVRMCTRTHIRNEYFPAHMAGSLQLNSKTNTWSAEGRDLVEGHCLQLQGMPDVHCGFVNPIGDGSPTWTAAASKDSADLDSAIDRGLVLPVLPSLRQQPACSFMGCLANSADPSHHDNLGCSTKGCVWGNAHCWCFKGSSIKFTQSFSKTTFRKPNQSWHSLAAREEMGKGNVKKWVSILHAPGKWPSLCFIQPTALQ